MRHLRTRLLFTTLALALFLTACQEDPAATQLPTRVPTVNAPAGNGDRTGDTEPPAGFTDHVVISEILAGIPGGNGYDFIELYNPTAAPVNLNGWVLNYSSTEGRRQQIIRWNGRADIPAFGHYLLVREGADVGVLPDATFEPNLLRRGGLILRNDDFDVVDAVGWATAPDEYFSGTVIDEPPAGSSLERLPGGDGGNGISTGNNAADFLVNAAPAPQNSGSAVTPPVDAPLMIAVAVPAAISAGQQFDIEVTVRNASARELTNVAIRVPIDTRFTLVALPQGAETAEDTVVWNIRSLPAGGESTAQITAQAPFDFFSTTAGGYYAEADGVRTYGTLAALNVAGGVVPIEAARGLDGATVTVEGIATMYTGGFFAGSTGTKFYVSDGTAGIQVYCPGGNGQLDVGIGDQVRITGGLEYYRTSLELIPCGQEIVVEIVERAAVDPEPARISIVAAGSDESVVGGLNQVEGVLTRIEEFSFSYEIDVMDAEGNSLLAYVDKLTGIDVEALDVGQRYRVTGITDKLDGDFRLMPRIQADFQQVFPPELTLTMDAPANAPAGSTIDVTLTATNYATATLTNVRIAVDPPTGDFALESFDPGQLTTIIDSIAPDGGSAAFTIELTVTAGDLGSIRLPGASATADQWSTPATAQATLIFAGEGVPIWAIQGESDSSPYVRKDVTTQGVVTGVFPDLGGFWIQDVTGDGNGATSDGVFVLADEEPVSVALLDIVRVTCRVREISNQTTFDISGVAGVVVLDVAGALPEPIELNPPAHNDASRAYFETLEGMLVAVTDPALAVAATSQYGEYALVRRDTGITSVARASSDLGRLIFVDDGSTAVFSTQEGLPYTVYRGDEVSELAGPLAFTFGNYKIQPLANPVITPLARALPPPLRFGPNEFTVATFNVENLFDPLPPPDGDDTPLPADYQLKLQKVADTILTMGAPGIIALQEVENIGVLDDLVALESLAAFNYEPLLIEGFDSRGIDNAYLVRRDRATIDGVAAYNAPEGLTSRPTLVISVTVTAGSGETQIYLLNNHFTSLSGGEAATEPRRTAQAAWNVTIAEQILAANPAANIVILGDLNSFYNTLPITTIQAAGFRHVYETGDADALFSYIFEGATQTLDHILVTNGLFDALVRVEAVHVNAGFPPPIPNDPSAQRSSDHDPIVATFVLP